MTKVFFAVACGGGTVFDTTPAGLDADGYVNKRCLSRKHIFERGKRSLGRLQLEYVDVLQCHQFDIQTPIEETIHLCVFSILGYLIFAHYSLQP